MGHRGRPREWLTPIEPAEFERLAWGVHEQDVAEGGDPAGDERFQGMRPFE